MVLAPRFTPDPMSASPTYDRCGTLVPSPISAFLISTYVPTFTPAASRVPGRTYAYGPISQPTPISHSRATVFDICTWSPTTTSVRRQSGPIVEPVPTTVRPSRI